MNTSRRGGHSLSSLLVTNFTKCPGLVHKPGKWWIPNGREAQEVTYCDYCKRTLNITNCYEFSSGGTSACNCDSYKLREHVVKSLFTVSVWNRELDTCYNVVPVMDLDYTGCVSLPTNTGFVFMIDASLPAEQLFSVDILCGDKPVTIKTLGGKSDILFKKSVLVKGFTTDDDQQRFLFVDRGSMSEEDWKLVDSQSEIVIKFHVYDKIPANYSQIISSNLGEITAVSRGHYELGADETGQFRHISSDYNDNLANTPLEWSVYFKNHYSRVTSVPIVMKVKLQSNTSLEETDAINAPVISSARARNLRDLRSRISRIEDKKRALEASMQKIQDQLSQYEDEMVETATKVSILLADT